MEGTNCQLYARTEMKMSGPHSLRSNLNHTSCEIYLQIILIFHKFTFVIVYLFCTIKINQEWKHDWEQFKQFFILFIFFFCIYSFMCACCVWEFTDMSGCDHWLNLDCLRFSSKGATEAFPFAHFFISCTSLKCFPSVRCECMWVWSIVVVDRFTCCL